MPRPQRVLWVLIAVGVLSGCAATAMRVRAERRNRRVSIAVDLVETKRLADTSGRSLSEVLSVLRSAGASAVAVSEPSVDELLQSQTITAEGSGTATVLHGQPAILGRIASALGARGMTVSRVGPESLAVDAGIATTRLMGAGIDRADVGGVTAAGLEAVGRLANFPGASETTMGASLQPLRALGIRTVIFSGLEVYGFRGQHRAAAAALRSAGLQYGQIEFGKQKGDEKLAVLLQDRLIRVHSISDGEMGTLDENEAVERFVRAARERNIRLCYVRAVTFAGQDPLETNRAYIARIAHGIARRGEMGLGAARSFSEPGVPSWLYGLVALSAAGGASILVVRLAPIGPRAAGVLTMALVAICVGLALIPGETGRKVVALLDALVFPVIACLRSDILGEAPPRSVPVSAAVAKSVRALLASSTVTGLGIVTVTGLMASRPFMIKSTQFMGIKAAHALPILAIALVAVVGLPAVAGTDAWRRMKGRLSAFLAEPVRVGALVIGLAAMVALAIALARTGNEPGVGVSGLELKVRSLLDALLPARPRTKEFMIGHPAFVLALGLTYLGHRRWAAPLFVIGVVGQVSLLNTFCHAHTPVLLSLVRGLSGIAIGAAAGAVLLAVAGLRKSPPTRCDDVT